MKSYLFLLSLFIFIGCHHDQAPSGFAEPNAEYKEDGHFQMPKTEESPPPPQPVQQKTNVPRYIIKNAEMRMQVKEVEASSARAIEQAKAIGGYLSQMETRNTNWETSNHLTLRIPVEEFENFLTKMGEESLFTDYRRVGTEDVTAEFVDLQARLKTRKEVKERFEKILREKTKTVEDVLNAEEKISRIQEEIEAAEGRLKYLSDRTSMSTVNLEFYERKEYEEHPVSYSEPFLVKLKEELVNGWEFMLEILLFFVNIWPVTLLFLGVWFGRKRVFRRFYRKKN